MKVLFLYPRFGIGGVAKALAFVTNVCAKDSMDVVCVSMSREPILIDLPKTAKKIYVDYREKGNRIQLLGSKAYFLLAFRRVVKREQPDVIVSFGTACVRIVTIATVGLGTKIIGSERGNPFQYTKRQKEKYIRALKKCYSVVFQTEQAMDYFPPDVKKKGLIIPNPCIAKPQIKRKISEDDKKVILTFARLSKEKNIPGIIRAFGRVQAMLTDFELHIYGRGPEKNTIERVIREERIKNVFLFDEVANVFDYESNCKMFVLNSEEDGFPNALLEAMLEGVPCIASDCPPGGVRFISDNGRRVHLVPVNNEEALSQAIVKVATDKEYTHSLVENSKEVVSLLDPQRIGEEWIRIIKAAANEKSN